MPRRRRDRLAARAIAKRRAVRGLRFESLERREMLAADLGDAATSTGAAYVSASHEAIGPKLGVLREANASAVANALANGDASDEDGVVFSVLRTSQAATMTVHVSDAPAGALVYAAIDFNRDGDWLDADERIAFNAPVVAGDNVLNFTVPAPAVNGNYHAYARVRLSTASIAGPSGVAPDGEVEDYLVPIAHVDSGPFGGQQPLSFNDASRIVPTDLDGDGDLDLLTSRMSWLQNINGRYAEDVLLQSPAGANLSVTASALAPADVDGDGDMDFFAGLASAGGVSWYENNGAERFTRRSLETGFATEAIAATDLDGDGDLDLVSAAGGAAHWYVNDGAQAFSKVAIPGSLTSVRSLVVDDMDGDGDLDIVAASSSAQTIKWLENDGSQQFTVRGVDAVSGSRSVATGDLDGDGDIDMVAAYIDGYVIHYENNGDESFVANNLDVTPWGGQAAAVAIADLDGDGDLDVAASGMNRVAWYENDGDGAFSRRIVSTVAGFHLDVAAADVDRDGRLDLVTTGTGTAPIAWYPQLAEYDYGDAPSPYRVYSQQNGPRHNAVGPRLGATRDAEADGAHAPAGTEAEDDGVVFGSLTLSESTGMVAVNVQNAPAGAKLDAWIDFDDDGSWGLAGEQIASSVTVVEGENVIAFAIPSWAVAGATYARIRVSTAGGLGPNGTALDGEVEDHPLTIVERAPATGLFGEPQLISSASSPFGGDFIVTTDVDGDGDADIVAKGGSGFLWSENLGPAGFAVHSVAAPGLSGEDMTAGDLDSDGDVDFVGFGIVQQKRVLIWAENDGEQNFTQRTSPLELSGASTFVALTIADVDADGDMDVLAAALSTGIYTLVNNGRQEFTPQAIGYLGDLVTSVVAADMDHDGDLDVVAGGIGAPTFGTQTYYDVGWFQNNGDLKFAGRGILRRTSPPFSGGGATESVAVGDVDGDGDLDVVSAGATDSSSPTSYATLWWHEQLADQTFVSHAIDFQRNFRWATLADFNGDGDLDIVASEGYSYSVPSTLDLFENLGSHFLRSTLAEIPGGSLNSAAADMDGDGDLDVVAQGLTSGYRISWFENFNLVDPDYGDAPAPYSTTRAESGPIHNGVGPRLGASRTSEADGVPSANADSDVGDDGVVLSPIQVGQASATVTVNVQNAPASAKLDVWIDFNGDGSWGGAGEQIFASYSVVEGDNALTFNIPENVVVGSAVARFRLSTAGGLRASGAAIDGEVEDYLLAVSPPAKATGEYLVGVPIGSGPGYSTPSPAQAIHVADIDGDGDADYLATAPDAWPRLAWYENLGDGAFLMHVKGLRDVQSVVGACPLDLDGDGDVDIAVVVSNGIGWLENDGSQNFTYRAATATSNSFSGVVDFADVDGDGDLDALAARASFSTQSLVILLNDGQQRFTPAATLTTLNVGASAIRAADVDRDGDIDFAVTFEGSNSAGGVAWYENDGAWSFHDVTRNAPTDPSRAGRDVVPIDFDFDGDVDFVASTIASTTQLALDVFRNDGQQNFTRETLATYISALAAASSPARGNRLQVADLDGDGDYDAVTALPLEVRLYRNEGQGFAQTAIHQFGAPISVAAAVGDVDGDGRFEILASEGRSSVVRLDDRPFGDYDRNGTVDQADRDLYEATLGQPAVPPGSGADGDRSGVVDAADLATWEANQGAAPTPPVKAADLDQNERIDGADFLLWQRAFGATSTQPGTHWADVDYTTTIDDGDLAVWKRQFGQGVAPPAPVTAVAATSVSSTAASATAMAIASTELEPAAVTSSPLPSPSPASRLALPASVILAAPPEKPASKKPDAVHLLKRNATSPRDAAFAALASPTTIPLRWQRLQEQPSESIASGDEPHAEIDTALSGEFLPSAFEHRVTR